MQHPECLILPATTSCTAETPSPGDTNQSFHDTHLPRPAPSNRVLHPAKTASATCYLKHRAEVTGSFRTEGLQDGIRVDVPSDGSPLCPKRAICWPELVGSSQRAARGPGLQPPSVSLGLRLQSEDDVCSASSPPGSRNAFFLNCLIKIYK